MDCAAPSTLLQAWRVQLREWSIDGSLSAAGQAALGLSGEAEALKELISEWAADDFKALPPIEVLDGSVMTGTAGAYALSTGTIYLNGDWLRLASEEDAIAVLSEELGHHLDGCLNTEETPGDEGEQFLLPLASEEEWIDVLSEDIGPYLDGWFNTEETLCDEGEHFSLLQAWRLQLREWSIDGSLSASGQLALGLSGEPEALKELISEWAAGDFKALPPIKILDGSVMPETAGAYAISTGTIYLNGDWLRLASQEQGIAVLSEELGHHLDSCLNTEEISGDEGEHFSLQLRQGALSPERLAAVSAEDDRTNLWIDGAWIEVEQATISTFQSPDASSLTYVNISGLETIAIEGDRNVPITFIRSGSLAEDVLIAYGIVGDTAVDGADFVAGGGTVLIPAGISKVSINVRILNDTLPEETESLSVSIINAEGASILAPRTHRISILDDEKVAPPLAPEPPLVSQYRVEMIPVTRALSRPTACSILPGNNSIVLVAEKFGLIKSVNLVTGQIETLLDLTSMVNSKGDRGIIAIELHPDLANNPYIYISAVIDPPDTALAEGNAGIDGAGNRYSQVLRYRLDLTGGSPSIDPGSATILVGAGGKILADISGAGQEDFTNPNYADRVASDRLTNADDRVVNGIKQDYMKVDSLSHTGGRLLFGPDGMLYVTTGDGGSFNYADPRLVDVQSLDSLSGKVLRIDPLTGLGLADNPFASSAESLSDNRAKIWQLGLRNPYTATFGPGGLLYLADVGWTSWEEINTGGPGANFGWPYFEGGLNGQNLPTPKHRDSPEALAFYTAVNAGDITVTPPLQAFGHTSNDPGYRLQCVIMNGTIPDTAPAALAGKLLFSDYVSGNFFAVDPLDKNNVEYLFTIPAPTLLVTQANTDGSFVYVDLSTQELGQFNIATVNKLALLSVAVEANQLRLRFSDAVTIAGLSSQRFTVLVDGSPRKVNNIEPTDTASILLLTMEGEAVNINQGVAITYSDLTPQDDITGVVQDLYGQDLAAIAAAGFSANTFISATSIFDMPTKWFNLTLIGGATTATGNSLTNIIQVRQQSDIDNFIYGGTGKVIDSMDGGGGSDIYFIENTIEHLAAEINDTGTSGTDELRFAGTVAGQTLRVFAGDTGLERITIGTGSAATAVLSGTTALNIDASAAPNALTITGNAGSNRLVGTQYNDTLIGGEGIDILIGGAGDDTYIVHTSTDLIREMTNAGNDTVASSVTFSLAAFANVENLTLTGIGAINGTGNNLNNVIIGNSSDNIFIGGSGVDTLVGGGGNDIYIVDSFAEVVIEIASEGVDRVAASISYSLSSEVENLVLTGTANLNGTGNGLSNIITGNTGDNILTGLDGVDTMIGGAGDDTYIVDTSTDAIKEVVNAGNDTVASSVTFSLAAIANVENLTLTGVAAINGTGNSLNNVILGNSAANNLSGGTGNDSLNGGAGIDTLIGGAGDDTYTVDTTTDVITEAANAGSDTVASSVSSSLAAIANVENLTLTGVAAINGTGNNLNNVILGNSAANNLSGGAGNDSLNGGDGNDTLIGGAGNDTLSGGLDADAFRFDSPFNTATNVDSITDFSIIQGDMIQLSRSIFTAFTTSGTLAASAFVIGAAATTANQRILYNSATGALSYDRDGIGAIGAIGFATLSSGLALTNSSFSII
jgi:Ca2+-binding RTX toxin-like protein/glucose/arabinose dehydrogenase